MTVRTPVLHRAMRGRDPDEAHRASTPLELLVDLCFVVAVAQAGMALHHELADGHFVDGIVPFLMVFFAIWWAWMNFTWFASAYDTDDVAYRLLTFVQIAGILVIASGIARAFTQLDYLAVTIGYVVMRVGLVAQWLRAAAEDPARRATALRFAIGVTVAQLGWVARLWLPAAVAGPAFVPLVALELGVPVWAERRSRGTPWHRAHIVERYGLFTIIVLGECILAASTAIQAALEADGDPAALVVLALGALVLIGAMWWAYFKDDAADDRSLVHLNAFIWGYGHYVVFAAVAAVGAGIQVAADSLHRELGLSPTAASLAVAVPVAAYLAAAWLVSPTGRSLTALAPVALAIAAILGVAVVIGPAGAAPAVMAIAIVVALLVGITAYGSGWRARATLAERTEEPGL
jgi:low temperature requirement protein LtrA